MTITIIFVISARVLAIFGIAFLFVELRKIKYDFNVCNKIEKQYLTVYQSLSTILMYQYIKI